MSRRNKRPNPLKPLGMWREYKVMYEPKARWRWLVRCMLRDRMHMPISEAGVADVFVAWRFGMWRHSP
jgi:hypothetical protein